MLCQKSVGTRLHIGEREKSMVRTHWSHPTDGARLLSPSALGLHHFVMLERKKSGLKTFNLISYQDSLMVTQPQPYSCTGCCAQWEKAEELLWASASGFGLLQPAPELRVCPLQGTCVPQRCWVQDGSAGSLGAAHPAGTAACVSGCERGKPRRHLFLLLFW